MFDNNRKSLMSEYKLISPPCSSKFEIILTTAPKVASQSGYEEFFVVCGFLRSSMAQPVKIQKTGGLQKSQPAIISQPKDPGVINVPDFSLGPGDDKALQNQANKAKEAPVSKSLRDGLYAPFPKARPNPYTVASASNKLEEMYALTSHIFKFFLKQNNQNAEETQKETETSEEQSNKKVTVGSFTCFQLIGGRTTVPKAVTTSVMAHSRIRYSEEHVSNGNSLSSKTTQAKKPDKPAITTQDNDNEEEEEEEADADGDDEHKQNEETTEQFHMESDEEESN
ncbi:hypothetical protein RFI_36756 [Reticulomyxa filosa]|uniref:Uncharacterized protein n=1 Tax=Reticulomyxa filosa TaxID=46433 RepID=X6LFA8_RETFI|nr:hypothetical protein RFI_36756 [Reticulomyxa filosa]|eukprot:ETO00683.1 hypothetical protein RFI_36756 [Reticulomyxa filosa]